MKKYSIIFIFLLLGTNIYSQNGNDKSKDNNSLEVKIAEVDGKQNANFKEVSAQIKSTEKQILNIEKQFDRFYELLYALLGFIAVIIGLILWDRRSSLRPFEKEISELRAELNEIKFKSENIEKRIDDIDLP